MIPYQAPMFCTSCMHSNFVCNPMQKVLHSSATHSVFSNSSCNPLQIMLTCSALMSTHQCSYSMQCCSLLPMHNTHIPMQMSYSMMFGTIMSIVAFQWNFELLQCSFVTFQCTFCMQCRALDSNESHPHSNAHVSYTDVVHYSAI